MGFCMCLWCSVVVVLIFRFLWSLEFVIGLWVCVVIGCWLVIVISLFIVVLVVLGLVMVLLGFMLVVIFLGCGVCIGLL